MSEISYKQYVLGREDYLESFGPNPANGTYSKLGWHLNKFREYDKILKEQSISVIDKPNEVFTPESHRILQERNA
jgi:hypothetical protein